MAESGAPGADSVVNPAYSFPMVAEGENETLAMPGENPGQARILTGDPGSERYCLVASKPFQMSVGAERPLVLGGCGRM